MTKPEFAVTNKRWTLWVTLALLLMILWPKGFLLQLQTRNKCRQSPFFIKTYKSPIVFEDDAAMVIYTIRKATGQGMMAYKKGFYSLSDGQSVFQSTSTDENLPTFSFGGPSHFETRRERSKTALYANGKWLCDL